MLSVKSFSAGGAGGAIANYITGNGAENYYGAGYWGGEGAKNLGLEGELKEGQLELALAGRNPHDGTPITNKVDEEHKPGWDLTFSAPKSVSLAFVALPEVRHEIMAAHEQAVKQAMTYMEKEAFTTRHGHNGVDKEPVLNSGGITYSVHHHLGSRQNDPDLHSHVPTANMTPDGRAIDLDTRQKMVGGALYRAELANGLERLGFAIEKDGTSFNIVGVSQELRDEYSKSANAIKEQMAKDGLSGSKSAADVAATIRADKSEETAKELIERVQPELIAKGLTLESLHKAAAIHKETAKEIDSPKQIIDELTSKDSTISELQLKAASIQASQGFHDASHALEHYADVVRVDSSIVNLQAANEIRLTTEAVIERETKMLETAERMAAKQGHPVAIETLKNSEKWGTLKQQQKEAVAHLTSSNDLSVLQGWAGTGKTYALGVAVDAWEKSGYTVLATAPSNKAVEELKNGAQIKDVINTTKLEIDLAKGNTTLDDKTVLIVDEAGMEGSRRIESILRQAEAAGAKVVLQGDTKQLQSIEAGAAMRGITEKVGAAELGHDSVTRQNREFDRENAQLIREGKGHEAITRLEKNGNIETHKDSVSAHQEAARAYLKDVHQDKDSVLVAFTRNEVNQLNQSVREELKQQGSISKDGVEVKTASGSREFAEGDKIIFGQKHTFDKENPQTEVINGSRGVVESVSKDAINVRLDSTNEVVKVDPEKYNNIDHGHATTVHKAQGASADTAHVVVGDRGSKEWAYVATSRHKEELKIHTTEKVMEREKTAAGLEKDSTIDKTFERDSQKDLSTDYKRVGDNPSNDNPNNDKPSLENKPSHRESLSKSSAPDHMTKRGQAIDKTASKAVQDKAEEKVKTVEKEQVRSVNKGNDGLSV